MDDKYIKADVPDIRRIRRPGSNMSNQDREKMLKILLLSFDEYFRDDYSDEDDPD